MEPTYTLTVRHPSGDAWGVVEVYDHETSRRVWSDLDPDTPEFYPKFGEGANNRADELARQLAAECGGTIERN